MEMEKKLSPVICEMTRTGALVDPEYCKAAIRFFTSKTTFAKEKFKNLTGRDFLKSGKLFAEVLADQKENWTYTTGKDGKPTNTPSFDKVAIQKLNGDVAETIKDFSLANSTIDFYKHFLFYRDKNNVIQ